MNSTGIQHSYSTIAMPIASYEIVIRMLKSTRAQKFLTVSKNKRRWERERKRATWDMLNGNPSDCAVVFPWPNFLPPSLSLSILASLLQKDGRRFWRSDMFGEFLGMGSQVSCGGKAKCRKSAARNSRTVLEHTIFFCELTSLAIQDSAMKLFSDHRCYFLH